MDAKTFESKAQGDFYLYYRKSGSNQTTYLTGTRDVHEVNYADEKLPPNVRANTNPDGSYTVIKNADGTLKIHDKDKVALWSYNSDKLRFLPLSRITRIVPLSSVLRNGNVTGRSL